jgi:hypothetical protein
MSVLVASTNNAAVDEAVARSNAAHPGTIVRTGNAEYRRALIVRLGDLLRGADQPADRARAKASQRAHAARREEARTAIAERAASIGALDSAAEDALDLAATLWGGEPPREASAAPQHVLERATRLRRAFWRFLARRRLIRELKVIAPGSTRSKLDSLCRWSEMASEMRAALDRFNLDDAAAEWRLWRERDDRWQESSRTLVEAGVQATLHDGSERLESLQRAFAAGDRDASALVDYLDVLPAWATSALSVRPNFRCQAGVFDLLVVDEASQCTLPAVLPLAFRAKRVVIVGDPNQLSPVVTLPSVERQQIPLVAGLDEATLTERHQRYGVDSCYDAFQHRAKDALLLDEHYRCHPAIARFCDAEFYSNRLHVLTDISTWADAPVVGLTWSHVDGRAEPGGVSGRINTAEAQAIVHWVQRHAGTLSTAGVTLGIVTPFAAQARLIERHLRSAVDQPTARLLELRVGTAHRFQGGERDVMLFSAVITAGVPHGTIGWLENNRHLVNVAVSRARRALTVFGDGGGFRQLGAATFEALYRHATVSPSSDDITLTEIERLLLSRLPDGADVRVGETVAAYPFPLTVGLADGRSLVIVVDGGQADASARIRQLNRDDVVSASGAEVMRIPSWLIRIAPEAASDLVEQRIKAAVG